MTAAAESRESSIALPRRGFLIGIGALAIAAALSCRGVEVARANADRPFSPADLVAVTAAGRFPFMVEVVDTPKERARGLMERRHLPANAGMLFDFGRPQPVSMWMKNTFISLDMVFLDDEGIVIGIATHTVPHSLTPLGVGRPVRAVLEVVAGTAERIQLRRGDRIEHRLFERPGHSSPGHRP